MHISEQARYTFNLLREAQDVMEVDYKAIFDYMLRSGLCAESDRPQAMELVEDWLNIYKETNEQQGDTFYGNTCWFCYS